MSIDELVVEAEEVLDTDPVPDELQDGDVVIEVGAYEGAWVAKIRERVNCTVHAYEPATRAFEVAVEKLGYDSSVTLWPFALGDHKGMTTLYDCNRDGANTFIPIETEPNEDVDVVDVALVMEWLGNVDLMHLNAEGGELDILERLLDTGRIEQVRMLLVQWHPYDDETFARIADVSNRLSETHELENRHAWGFWRLKDTIDRKETICT